MKIMLAGDTNLQNRNNPADAFREVCGSWRNHDIVFLHAEGMFIDDPDATAGPYLTYKELWHHPSAAMASGFVDAGVSGVSMASNVSADREAVRQCLANAEMAGLRCCGIGLNRAEARKPLILEGNGQKVAFLGRTSVYWPHIVNATEHQPGAATMKAHTAYAPGRRTAEMPGAPPQIRTWADPEELADLVHDIQTAKQAADFLVLSIHWGVSSSTVVQDYQREVGHAAIDAGADIVMGHHPHLIQEIELYHSRPIFHSVGNFAFDWKKMRGRRREGLMLDVELTAGKRLYRVLPVQRNEENTIRILSPSEPDWQSIANYLVQEAKAELRDVLQITDKEIRFTV